MPISEHVMSMFVSILVDDARFSIFHVVCEGKFIQMLFRVTIKLTLLFSKHLFFLPPHV